jgi:hypothetical protein
MLKHKFKILFIIILAVGISLSAIVELNHKIDRHILSAASPKYVTPLPSNAAPSPIQTIMMETPDGTKTLTMKRQKVDSYLVYSFFTSAKSDNSEKLIFRKVLISSQSLSIPYNTWSPDNVYFFLKETTPTVNNYYVFNSSGSSFPDGSQYVNIQDLFSQKLPQYTIDEVTGWGAPDLIIVNAKKNERRQKYSFWFEVSSQSFIQLSTYFD